MIEHSVGTYSTVHGIFAYLPEPVQLSLIMKELTWLHIYSCPHDASPSLDHGFIRSTNPMYSTLCALQVLAEPQTLYVQACMDLARRMLHKYFDIALAEVCATSIIFVLRACQPQLWSGAHLGHSIAFSL